MKLVSMLVALCFTANVFAATGTASALQQTFDNYQYSMSVEWDQKDQAASQEINEKFFGELATLVKDQGLSQTEIQAFAESKIVDKAALEAMKLKLSLLTNVSSSKELASVLSENARDFYSKGASWNGDVALYVGVGVLIAALIGYSVWFNATHECVAYSERWECSTSSGSYDYYYDSYYSWDRTYYTTCGWVSYCTDYVKK